MASFFFFLVAAQVLLSQKGYSYKIDGVRLKSSKDFISRVTTARDFKINFSGGEGINKTIFTLSNGPITAKIIHRSESLMSVDFSSNGTLVKTCPWTVSYSAKYAYASMDSSEIFVQLEDTGLQFCRFSHPEFSRTTTVYIGDPFAIGTSFTGIVACTIDALYLLEDICFAFESKVFSDQLSLWSKNGDYYIDQISLIDICKKQGRFVLINDRAVIGFDDIQSDYCQHLGGRSLDREDIFRLKSEFLPKAKQICRSSEGDTSVKLWTGVICQVLNLESERTEKSCLPESACFLCFIRKRGPILTIGEKDTGLFRDELEFIEEGETEENPDHFMLRGPSAKITFKDNEWQLHFQAKRVALSLNNSILPFGRRRWYSKIAKGKSHEIDLNNCNEWMCNDGTCYRAEVGCDGNNDCSDATDEDNYCDIPYFPGRGAKDIITLEVDYNVSVVEIDEIKADSGSIPMTLKFALEWIESRVYLRDTKINHIDGSQLPFNPSRDLALTNCVKSEEELEIRHMNSLFWIDTSTISIHQRTLIRNTFTVGLNLPCEYDYTYFPFGKQKCALCIRFSKDSTNPILKTIKNSISMEFSEKRGDFMTKNVSQELYNEFSKIRILFTLQSLSSYHVLTSFTPSTLMCVVAYATLYFNLGFFSERIGVSTTSLLTLVVLFTDVSDRIVKTSYIKLIDGWFIWCMTFTAAIVIINSVLHYLMHPQLELKPSSLSFFQRCLKKKKKKKRNLGKRAIRYKKGTDEVIIVEGNPEDHEVKDKPSSVHSKALKLIPIERKLNIAARVVLLALLLASIFALIFIKW